MKDGQEAHLYEFAEFRVDAAQRVLSRSDGASIPLTPKIFDTLLYFVQHSGKVIGKDELMREIWPDTIVEENNLNKNISVLRRVLGEKPGEHRFILTVAGAGYKFVAPVTARENVETREAGSAEAVGTADVTAGTAEPSRTNMGHRMRRRGLLTVAVAVVLGLGVMLTVHYRRQSAEPPVRTIAVLPFKPLVAGDRDEALEVGMADTLILRLGAAGQRVVVRPLGSVRKYQALDQDPLRAGRELAADSVLDGSIQRSADRIRVNVRLLNVADGTLLWGDTFEDRFTDIFSLQDSISERLAAALDLKAPAMKAKTHPTENVEAFQLYMKGRFYVLRATKDGSEKAVSNFQEAIRADPHYALAYVGLADAYRALAVGGEMPAAEYLPKAKEAAKNSIRIDDTLAEGHAMLGHILFWSDWDWTGAEKEYKRALELDPNSADALQFYAHVLSATGRHKEALLKIRRAREIDPLNVRISALEGLFLLHAGQADEAITRLGKALEMQPDAILANNFLARAYLAKGMFAQASEVSKKASELSHNTSGPMALNAYALAKSGRVAEAKGLLDEMVRSSKKRHVPPYNVALVYMGLGESTKALDHLEEGLAERDVRMVFLKVEPEWNSLRAEPRFKAIAVRMKLE